MIKKYFALSLIAASVAVAGCSDDDDDDTNGIDTPIVDETPASPTATPGMGGSVYDFIVNSDQHTSLRLAIETAGLADTLDDETKSFTVFAPDDAAFEALNTEEAPTAVADLMADTAALTRVLQYHVLPAVFNSEALAASVETEESATFATLIDGESVTITNSETANTGLAVNATDIAAADLVPEVAEGETTVGVVHSIVAVLEAPVEVVVTPDPGEGEPGEGEPGTVDPAAGSVAAALSATNSVFFDAFTASFGGTKLDLATDDDPWTVFAPTDAAAGATEIVVANHIITGTNFSAQALIDAGTLTTFGETTLTFGGTADALTINGFDAVLVGDGTAASATYSVDGVL